MTRLVLEYLHVIGVMVLIGAGAACALFAAAAQRARYAPGAAVAARLAVRANLLLTALMLGVEPLSGLMLARADGYAMTEGWIVVSIMVYILLAVLWLPVLWIQVRLYQLARDAAADNRLLPAVRRRLTGLSVALAMPAAAALLAIFWLMTARPAIRLW